MSSRFGTRTYSRKPACQSSIQFEKVFNEKANRPTASKSAGILHKWGKTSFTSIRNNQVNGQKEEPEVVKRPKLALPVHNNDDDPFSFDLDADVTHNPSKMAVTNVAVPVLEPKLGPSVPRPNKFFKSGNRGGTLQTYSKRLATSKTMQKSEEAVPSPSLPPVAVVEQLDTVSVDVVLGNCLSSVVCSNSVVAYPSLEDQHKNLTAFDELFRTASKSPRMRIDEEVHPLSPVSSPLMDETDSQTMLFSPRTHMASASNSVNHNSSSEEQEDSNDVEFSSTETVVNRRVVRTYSSLRSRGNASAVGVTVTPSAPLTLGLSSTTVSSNPTPIVLRFSGCNTLRNITVSSSTSAPPATNTAALFTPSPTTTGLEGEDSSSHSQELWSQDPDQSSESFSAHSAVSVSVGSPQQNDTANQSKLTWGISGSGVLETEPQNVDSSAPVSEVALQSIERTQPPNSSSPSVAIVSSESELPSSSTTDEAWQLSPPAEETKVSCVVTRPTRTTSLRSRRIFNSPKKQMDKKALYKHRPWQADEDEAKELESQRPDQKSLSEEFDEETEDEIAPLVRVTTWPTRIGEEAITSLRCSKKAKELYKVVRNVKQAHQCHEIGETQEFNDDIEYLLDGLQDTIPTSTRCLSVLSLASKCMVPGFRMHLRAHGTISKIFSALHDAPSEPNMALCTATVMFILSQDRLNMDLERSSLELMLALLDTESTAAAAVALAAKSSASDTPELGRNLAKVRDLCEEVQKKGHARHLSLDNITSGHLAMETLLSLTSRRAGEWFKEELRELGGLEHIVATVSQCVKFLGKDIDVLTKAHFDKISKVDRCLRVLENVTFMNTENQSYLIEYKDALLVVSIVKVLRLTTSFLPYHTYMDKADRDCPGAILFGTVLTVLRVLLNLTNENSYGSMRIGEQDGLVEVTLRCILHMPKFVPVEQVFDLLILSLGLLINLVEHCTVNRRKLLAADVPPLHTPTDWLDEQEDIPAITALVNLFVEREETARQEEAKTDSLLDGSLGDGNTGTNADGAPNSQPSQDDIEDTLTKALQKAGKHMEDSMVAAYVALLLGCVVQDGEEAAQLVRDQLPENSFLIMVQILQKFLNFIHLTSTVGNTGMKSIQRVIEVLESC